MTRRFCDLCDAEIPQGKHVYQIVISLKEGALTDDGVAELEACSTCVDRIHRAFAEMFDHWHWRH